MIQLDKQEKIHNKLCDKIDKLTKKFNPCNIREEDGKLVCTDGKICCAPCKYLTETGCSIKSLGCKLYFCYTIQKKYPDFYNEVYKLRIEAKKHRLIKMREPFR